MKICLIDKSADPAVTQALLVKIASAMVVQVARDLAGWWEVTPDELMVAAAAPAGWYQMIITKTLDDPQAVAYHSVLANGQPLLRVGLDMVRAQGGVFEDELSIAMSHEHLETRCDPYACYWSEYDGKKKIALETADPVQDDSYEIDGVRVSNFVGPRWFDFGSSGPFDFMGKLTSPLAISPGGYLIFDDGSQAFGEKFPEHKKALVGSLGRRARCAHHRALRLA